MDQMETKKHQESSSALSSLERRVGRDVICLRVLARQAADGRKHSSVTGSL